MTTRGVFGPRPRLNRLLTRQRTVTRTVTTPATPYRHRFEASGTFPAAGKFDRDLNGRTLYLAIQDADGRTLPQDNLQTPFDLQLQLDGAAPVTASVRSYLHTSRGNVGPVTLGLLRFTEAVAGLVGVAADAELLTTFPGQQATTTTTMETVMERLWCQRRDLSIERASALGAGFAAATDVVFVVRADGEWETGQTFEHDGESYTVQRLAELLGPEAYLELQGRRVA